MSGASKKTIKVYATPPCPKCGSATYCIDTRWSEEQQGTRRRRACAKCLHRYSTIEIPLNHWSKREESFLELREMANGIINKLEDLLGID